MDFWQWVALTWLALLFCGVVLGGIRIWSLVRQTRAITRQTGDTTGLIATAEERTKALMLEAEERTQRILARMGERR